MDMDCDVLVVGLGPVGGVLAALLGQTGRSIVAIEPNQDVYPLPRAAHIDHEIMRIFQAIGVADRIVPHIRVAPDYEFKAVNGDPLILIERETLIGVSGWPASFNIHQPGIERSVRERLTELANVRTIYGAHFVNIEERDADGVTVAIEGPDGPASIRAKFVVGCDGAWSPVREACGIVLDDYAFDEPWLVMDAVVEDESGFPPRNLQLCDPNRPTTFVHMGPGRLRWEFMLKPDEDPAAMREPENVDVLLQPWRHMGRIEVERVAVYRFHGIVAERWRDGRILLAGDAAHQMPPFLGQGLCSGLRDAVNIAWKIDEVLGGRPLALLDTYQEERDAHVRAVIERAIEMGRVVCTLDASVAAARDEEMLANPYVGPPATFPALRGLTLDDTPAAGALFPQARDEGEGRLDDVLGAGAWLIHDGTTEPPVATDLRVVDVRRDLPPKLAAQVSHWLEQLAVEAVLVRPDRQIFGTGRGDELYAAWHRKLAIDKPT